MKLLVVCLFCCACFFGGAAFGDEVDWGEAKHGLAVRLLPGSFRFFENDDPSINELSRLDFELEVKNISGKPLSLYIPVDRENLAHTLEWDIRNQHGELFRPTFLPPPMPFPGPKPPPVSMVLQPGEIMHYTSLHGVSGFQKDGDTSRQGLRMLPAGEYELVIRNLRVAGSDEPFVSNTVKITVQTANGGTNGPSLTLPDTPPSLDH